MALSTRIWSTQQQYPSVLIFVCSVKEMWSLRVLSSAKCMKCTQSGRFKITVLGPTKSLSYEKPKFKPINMSVVCDHPKDGGSKLLQEVCQYLLQYMAKDPRIQTASHSSLWDHEVSPEVQQFFKKRIIAKKKLAHNLKTSLRSTELYIRHFSLWRTLPKQNRIIT